MRKHIRRFLNHLFTGLSGFSAVLMGLALLIILGPIVFKGATAVFFRGTVEFREMQLNEFDTGDKSEVDAELAEAMEARAEVYAIIDRFKRGMNAYELERDIKRLYRAYKDELEQQVYNNQITTEREDELKDITKDLRNLLRDAYETQDREEALGYLNEVLEHPSRSDFDGSLGEKFFTEAEDYKKIVQTVDLAKRDKYTAELEEVRDLVQKILGPRPGERTPEIAQFRYGVPRWDMAEKYRHQLVYKEVWVSQEDPSKPRIRTEVPRAEIFEGTRMADLFSMFENNMDAMLRPEFTFYWRYFAQESTAGHYFGGVLPEIIGTLLITALSMVFAMPVGIITAAYMIECTRENLLLRIIRTCINTLAGVPSIVFGLFGLAFFVIFLLPRLNLTKGSSILAGSLTLAVLVLPVIIRASEEAIRAVPQSYREASLSLGASKVRTFLTVTFPSALPGILTGFILSMSRAAGETAPIMFTAAVAYGGIPDGILDKTPTLSYGSYSIAVGDNLAKQVPHNQFGMIMVLVMMVLLLNAMAIVVRSVLSKRLRGGA
ncbi:MAG: phosphate ABC transporter permease PstA [Phycisphaerae bacterium]